MKRRDEINKRIGNNLKQIRLLYNISQQELAEILQLQQSAVSRIEDGKQDLAAPEFVMLRDWLKQQPNVFLE